MWCGNTSVACEVLGQMGSWWRSILKALRRRLWFADLSWSVGPWFPASAQKGYMLNLKVQEMWPLCVGPRYRYHSVCWVLDAVSLSFSVLYHIDKIMSSPALPNRVRHWLYSFPLFSRVNPANKVLCDRRTESQSIFLLLLVKHLSFGGISILFDGMIQR